MFCWHTTKRTNTVPYFNPAKRCAHLQKVHPDPKFAGEFRDTYRISRSFAAMKFWGQSTVDAVLGPLSEPPAGSPYRRVGSGTPGWGGSCNLSSVNRGGVGGFALLSCTLCTHAGPYIHTCPRRQHSNNGTGCPPVCMACAYLSLEGLTCM
jgi:hypothetical protein